MLCKMDLIRNMMSLGIATKRRYVRGIGSAVLESEYG